MLSSPYVIQRGTWNRVAIMDQVVSLVWTERFNEFGDCKLVVPYSHDNLHFLRKRWYLEIDESDYLMMIEGVQLTRDQEGQELIEVTGYSVEKFFQHRTITPNRSDPEFWVRTGRALVLAGQLVERICIDGNLSSRDIIPNLRVERGPGVGELFDVQMSTKKSLYDNVKELCDSVDGGFRIFWDHQTKLMTFKAYAGLDRTTEQSTYAQVIFSRGLNNAKYLSFLDSQIDHKTAAQVDAGSMTLLVNAPTGASMGMDYRLLYVDASDIENPTTSKLRARGLEELSQHKLTKLVEVESVNTIYRYKTHFWLGDLVTLERPDGTYTKARVTEFVRTLDSSGYHEYPTFEDLENDVDYVD